MAETYKAAFAPVQLTKIPAGSGQWREFNGSFRNVELPQLEIASQLYDGHPITTWQEPSWRAGKNFKYGQHLGLDFDTCDPRSSIPTLLKDNFIAKHAAILYTTPSHTPDAPRARVIFLLDVPIQQARNYALAATALLWLYGAADRQCKDPARYFYGGRPGACEMEWPANVLSLELVKDLIRRYQATGKREHKHRTYEPRDTDQADIVSALQSINAWSIQYDEWLSILMAIHSELPGADGLLIAEGWADGRPDEVASKWQSFHGEGNVGGRVGLGTLFSMAGDRGWSRSE